MAGTQPLPPPDGSRLAKLALRDQLLAARKARSATERTELARACAEHLLAAEEVRRAHSVAAYVAVGSEPGTAPLLAGLLRTGTRVLLPVLLPDGDLDWAAHAGESSLYPASYGLLEPTGTRLGPGAIADVDAVLVPGLAVDTAGTRLGKGRGCYDRALARVPAHIWTCVLLHPDEVGRAVPSEPHDRPVAAAVTAEGIRRFSRPARG